LGLRVWVSELRSASVMRKDRSCCCSDGRSTFHQQIQRFRIHAHVAPRDSRIVGTHTHTHTHTQTHTHTHGCQLCPQRDGGGKQWRIKSGVDTRGELREERAEGWGLIVVHASCVAHRRCSLTALFCARIHHYTLLPPPCPPPYTRRPVSIFYTRPCTLHPSLAPNPSPALRRMYRLY
jgi:hypothetical protein